MILFSLFFLTELLCIVRLRDLPWSAIPAAILKFFHNVSVCSGESGVHITQIPDGQSTGEAFVVVMSEHQVDNTLAYSKEHGQAV